MTDDVLKGITLEKDVLDHGFVRLVDCMPRLIPSGQTADYAICQAARVSYGQGTKSVREDRGLIRYLLRNRHCYHPSMEVLTARGWVRWDECDEREIFLIPDPETRRMKPELLNVEIFDADEEMVTFENQRMSFCVTADHRMWFKGKYEEKFHIRRAGEIKKWGHFDPLKGYEFDRNAMPDQQMLFVGFFLGDGSFGSRNRLTFHLRKTRKIEFLRGLIDELGLISNERPSKTYEKAVVITITTPDWMHDMFGDHIEHRAKDKMFPGSIDRLSANERDGLLKGLIESDGSSKNDRPQIQFHSASPHLLKLVQNLWAFRGVDAHVAGHENNVTAYEGERTSLEAREQYFGREHYCGKVYCATSSTGLLMVRGGPDKFAFVCGNTSPFEMVEFKFHCKMPIFVARQWVRHRTACLTADTVLHFDLPGGVEQRGNQLYKLTVGEVFEKFQPTENTSRPDKQRNPHHKRDRVQNMMLRSLDEETGEVVHTNIVDIWESGYKPVYRVETEGGSWAKMSEDHLCLTPDGWKKLRELSHPVPTDHGLFAFELEQNKNAKIMIIGPGRDTGVVPQFNPIDEATETWKSVVGWENYYEVSDQGRVRRVVGGRGSRSFGRCKNLTPSQGHAKVSLNRPGEQATKQVHQLVMEAFVGLCPVGQECIHEDGNGLNNRLGNLRWGTPLRNAQDSVRDGATTRLMARPEKIVKIERLPDEITYDLEVSGPHNFSANGLVVHNSLNEYSGRYSEMKAEFYQPQDVRGQSTSNKQGSEGVVDVDTELRFREYLGDSEMLYDQYDDAVRNGVAKELARIGLPLSMYTEWYWKMDLHNLLHFLRLRMDEHAQLEIRLYANAIYEIIKQVVPLTIEAFEDYRLNAITYTKAELAYLADPEKAPLSKTEARELSIKMHRAKKLVTP